MTDDGEIDDDDDDDDDDGGGGGDCPPPSPLFPLSLLPLISIYVMKYTHTPLPWPLPSSPIASIYLTPRFHFSYQLAVIKSNTMTAVVLHDDLV